MKQPSRKSRRTESVPFNGGSPTTKGRDVEQRLALVLEATTDGYWDWKLCTGIVHYGKGWLSSLGYGSADLPKDTSFWESIIHPDDLPEFDSHLQEHLRGATQAVDREVRLRARSGQYKWFRARGKVVERDSRGAATRMVGTVVGIQSRKLAQMELEKSRAQLESLLESTNDIVWSVDARDFGLVTFNKPFDDLVFAARAIHAKFGMRPEDLYATESAAGWSEFYTRVLEHGDIDCDSQLFAQPLAVHLTAHRLVRGGCTFGISVFGHDITERKKMEEALRKSEEKFSKAFLQSPLALTLTSTRDHRYIEVNDSFELSTGYSREEVIGRTPFELGIWANPEERIKLVEGLQKPGRLRNAELHYLTKSGETRDGLGSAALIEVDGELCMLSVIADITDRKRAERALQESEERLRLAVESGRMYAFEWNSNTDIVQRSSESSEILNLQDHCVPLTKAEFLERVHPDDREHYNNATESPTAQRPTYKTAFRFLTEGQRVTWLEESGHAFFSDDGKVHRIVGIVADITEAKQSERVLRELTGRLITSQEEERRRVARELHDNIGQELALLSVQAQRMDSGASEAEHTAQSDVHELYRRIKETATNVSNLSHRLHSSELEFLGLGSAVERLCRDFSRQYGIDLEYAVKDVPKQIVGGSSLCFYRVIQEALQNIAKHSHATHVELELVHRNGELSLKVSDNGRGFATKSPADNCGLGLLSMKERMNLIGGRFHLSSKMGQGTKIEATVALP